jgi:hypothetical protein
VALMGGGTAAVALQNLTGALGEPAAVRLREQGTRLLAECVERVLAGERHRRGAPLHRLAITPDHQVELVAALSTVRTRQATHVAV